jgi:hypothetical protein
MNRKLAILLTGDYGGFDVASESTWEFIGMIGPKTAKRQELRAGYRTLSVDRQSGGFLLDVTFSGPIVAYTFGL